MIGCPNDGASESRTVRGTTLRQTLSPKCSRTSLHDLVGQLRAGVVHHQDDGADLERRVEVLLHEVDVAQQLAQALEGVVLALDRDEHLGGRRQAVDGEQAERGRAVDEDEVVVVAHLLERPLEAQLTAEGRDELDLGAGQVEGGRGARTGSAPRSARRSPRWAGRAGSRRTSTPCRSRMLMPEPGGGVALRIEVDDQHPVAEVGQAGAEVDGRGRLAHAALLVGDGDDPGERPGERRRLVGRAPASAARLVRVGHDRSARRGVGVGVRQIRRRRGAGPGAGGASGAGRSGRRRGPRRPPARRPSGAALVGRFRLLRGALAAVARVAASEPLEDGPPPGGQIIRRVAHRRILPAGRPGRKDPAPCSTWNPRPVVPGCSTWNTVRRAAAWPGARRGGGRSRGTRRRWRERLHRGRRGGPRRRSPSPSRASPAAGHRSGRAPGGSLTTSRPPTREQRRGALGGHGGGAEAAGDDGRRSVPRQRRRARPPPPDPRRTRRTRAPGPRRPARGTRQRFAVASSEHAPRGRAGRRPRTRPGTPPPLPRSTTRAGGAGQARRRSPAACSMWASTGPGPEEAQRPGALQLRQQRGVAEQRARSATRAIRRPG